MRGNRVTPNSGFSCFEQILQEIQIPDAYACVPAASGEIERLVQLCQSERRVFAHSYLSPPTDSTSGLLSRGAVTSIACNSSASLLAREYSCDAMYLKDWLLLAQSRQEVKACTRILLQHLQNLGFFNKPGKEHAVSCSRGAVNYSLSEGGTFQGF